MLDFVRHRADILLATTIIESGVDIPNANTMFIDQAENYGSWPTCTSSAAASAATSTGPALPAPR